MPKSAKTVIRESATKLFDLSLIPKIISPVIPYPSNNLPSYPLSLKPLTGPHQS